MPPLDVLLISSENVPEGYVSLLNGPTLVWYGKVRNIPEDIEYNRVVVNPVDYRACFANEEALRIQLLEKEEAQ
jgi:hypothetical protein